MRTFDCKIRVRMNKIGLKTYGKNIGMGTWDCVNLNKNMGWKRWDREYRVKKIK